MRDFTKRAGPRRQTTRFITGVVGLLVLSLVTFGAAHAAWGMYGKFSEAAVSDADAEQNLEQLKAREAQMSSTVTELSSERGQEAQIREAYGVALPGEGEIQIIEAGASTTPEATAQPNFFVKMFRALFVW